MRKTIIYTLLLILLPLAVLSQGMQLSTTNKKAIKAYFKATAYYEAHDLAFADIELERALKADPNFIEAWMLKGDIKEDQKNPEESIKCYIKAIEINPDFFPRNYYNVARMEFGLGKYIACKEHYETYLTYPSPNPHLIEKINHELACCNFAIGAMANPVPFNPVNMGPEINTQYDEYSPTLTVDERTFIFTRQRPRDDMTVHQMSFEEDFFISNAIDTVWSPAQKMPPPINSHGNEGAQCISPDGQYMYFTICNKEDGFGSCDLYFARRQGERWSSPVNMGRLVNSSTWDSQPTISPDGTTLYFSSARSGTIGNMDLWCTRFANGAWQAPENLGPTINTPKGEMSPFIHPDGQTLYFTSNGHVGMGANDIYVTRMDTAGKWQEPINLGYPINTFKDEGFLIVNGKGNKAYFSSGLFKTDNGMDLYTFDLYEGARPVTVTYMKGIVYDKNTRQLLEAHFELIDLESGEIIVQSNSDPVNGEFMVSLPNEKNYALNVSREGYLFYSENFTLKGTHDRTDPFLKDIPLQPMESGVTVVLKNIFFDFDKFDLLPESQVELTRLVDLLKKNPKMNIEIGGHTDNKGSKEYNQLLSENRAKAVYTYLIDHGIANTRLSYKGYGLEKPIDTNDTDEGRANNRRTEFKVISF